MKIERIIAENYGSFEQFDISFAALGRIFTVSGSNGAGKTTLFNAVCVLLYEETPGEGKGIAKYARKPITWGDDKLPENMRKAKTLPVLKLAGVFQLGKFWYRIERVFDPNTKNGGHCLILKQKPADSDPAIWDESDGVTVEVKNKQTIPETQKLIEQIFGNYRSFVTGTFMSHGASEFLHADDESREEVLAYLCDCEKYGERLKITTEKRKAAGDLVESKKEFLKKLYEKVSTKDASSSEAADLESKLNDVKTKIQIQQGVIESKQSERDLVNKQMAECVSEKQSAGQAELRIKKLNEKIAGLVSITENADEIKANANSLREVRKLLREKQESLSLTTAVKTKIAELKNMVASVKRDIETNICHFSERLAALGASATRVKPETEKIESLNKRLLSLGENLGKLERVKTSLSKLAVGESTLKSRILQHETRMNELRDNITSLRTAAAHCPTCERAFSQDSEKQCLVEKFIVEGKGLKVKVDNLKLGLIKLAEAKCKYDALSKSLSMCESEKVSITSEIARSEQVLIQAQESQKEVGFVTQKLDGSKQELEAGKYAFNERKQIAEYEQQLSDINFNETEFRELQVKEKSLAGAELDAAKLENADAEISALKSDVAAEELSYNLSLGKAGLYNELSSMLYGVDNELAGLKTGLNELLTISGDYSGSYGAAKLRYEEALKAESEYGILRAEIETLSKRHAILKVLESAYNPRGIPMMRYKKYIPLLNNKINYALSAISSGWSVKITADISSRGKFIVTVKTIDPTGVTLNYSSRSAGEKFIIALAALIGIGLFWGERTGTRPETLRIDEGFDALDVVNRERAKSAIAAASINFGQVGIISHSDEILSLGEVQLYVRKDSKNGSQIEIAGANGCIPLVKKIFFVEKEAVSVIDLGVAVLKEQYPGMSDGKAIEFALAEKAIEGSPKNGARKVA